MEMEMEMEMEIEMPRLDSSCLPGHGGCVTLLLACWLAA